MNIKRSFSFILVLYFSHWTKKQKVKMRYTRTNVKLQCQQLRKNPSSS